jgi:hypothetical protein
MAGAARPSRRNPPDASGIRHAIAVLASRGRLDNGCPMMLHLLGEMDPARDEALDFDFRI